LTKNIVFLDKESLAEEIAACRQWTGLIPASDAGPKRSEPYGSGKEFIGFPDSGVPTQHLVSILALSGFSKVIILPVVKVGRSDVTLQVCGAGIYVKFREI
jgi:hypothetical protein